MTRIQSRTQAGGAEEWPRRYLQYLQNVRRLSANTLTAYRHDIDDFLGWYQDNGRALRLTEIDEADVVSYLAGLDKLAANTIRRRAHALLGWFKFLVRQEVLDSNPVDDVQLPRRQTTVPNVPSREEVQRLIAAATKPKERVIVWLLATTGLRRAELLGLDVGDIADDFSQVRVRGKGNKQRLVPLPQRTQQILAEYLQWRGRDPGPLLRTRTGNWLGPATLRRIFLRLLRQAGLEEAGYTPHSLRHFYATQLMKAGVDPATIGQLLGHSGPWSTWTYLHSDFQACQSAAEAAGAAVSEPGDGDE